MSDIEDHNRGKVSDNFAHSTDDSDLRVAVYSETQKAERGFHWKGDGPDGEIEWTDSMRAVGPDRDGRLAQIAPDAKTVSDPIRPHDVTWARQIHPDGPKPKPVLRDGGPTPEAG